MGPSAANGGHWQQIRTPAPHHAASASSCALPPLAAPVAAEEKTQHPTLAPISAPRCVWSLAEQTAGIGGCAPRWPGGSGKAERGGVEEVGRCGLRLRHKRLLAHALNLTGGGEAIPPLHGQNAWSREVSVLKEHAGAVEGGGFVLCASAAVAPAASMSWVLPPRHRHCTGGRRPLVPTAYTHTHTPNPTTRALPSPPTRTIPRTCQGTRLPFRAPASRKPGNAPCAPWRWCARAQGPSQTSMQTHAPTSDPGLPALSPPPGVSHPIPTTPGIPPPPCRIAGWAEASEPRRCRRSSARVRHSRSGRRPHARTPGGTAR
eukprot:scaffold11431_cov118-Isochrysis_galbana.AAC.3